MFKKTDYNTKIADVEKELNNHNHDKYIDTSEFNKLATDVFNARLPQANLITKTDFDAKLSSLNRKITQNTTFVCWKWIWKLLIWVNLLVKIISKTMVHKII